LDCASILTDMLQEVSVDAGAAEDADRTFERARVVAGALQRLPGALEKQPMLRIRQLRLALIHPEKFRIEQIDALEHRPRLDEVGLMPHLVGKAVFELIGGEAGD